MLVSPSIPIKEHMMSAPAATPRVTSYFFLVDFHYMKGASDELDVLPDAIVYFYPPKEDLKKQKLLDCGEIIGLMQYFKYDLFSCVPREYHFKKSLVTCQDYGRHCAFLVLSRDRFTTDEGRFHLQRILQLFHTLYGTWNHLQTIHRENAQMQEFLRQTMTPLVDYAFNLNRSVQNLFSAINYLPFKRSNQRFILESKHLLSYLHSAFDVQDGLIAYEKRILCSTFDTDVTYYLQTLLNIQNKLPGNLINVSWGPEVKLKNGVSLIHIYLRQPTIVVPIPTTSATEPVLILQLPKPSESIDIIQPSSVSGYFRLSMDLGNSGPIPSLSTSDSRDYISIMKEYQTASSGETGFETDRTDDASASSHTESTSFASSVNEHLSVMLQKSSKHSSDSSLPVISDLASFLEPPEGRKNSIESKRSFHNSHEGPVNNLNNPDDQITLVQVRNEEYESGYDEEDVISLPPMSMYLHSHRVRSRTMTNHSETNPGEHSTHHHSEGKKVWGNISEQNDEHERESLVLYIQRNSRMMIAGTIKQSTLSEEYLQKLWLLIMSEMAKMDTDIQILPEKDESTKIPMNMKFQYLENMRLAQFERVVEKNQSSSLIPSSESVTMSFAARSNLRAHPERKMIGFSRGNHFVSVDRRPPNRTTYSCRRFQEF